MTFKQAFDETLSACSTPALKKRFCTNELKALRAELADQKAHVAGCMGSVLTLELSA